MAHVQPPNGDEKECETRVIAYGSNLFCQLGPQTLTASSSPVASSKPRPTIIVDAIGVVAVCTYQTVYKTRSGKIKVIGESAHLLSKAVDQIDIASLSTSEEGCEATLVGQDIFEAVIDIRAQKCYFIDYHEHKISVIEMKHQPWRTAAADGRGRCMAIDRAQDAFLFDSISSLKAATRCTEEARKLRDAKRFIPYKYKQGGILEAYEEDGDEGGLRPFFVKVVAGNAHFVLLGEPALERRESACSLIWIFGDARFGAVPIEPFPGTSLIWRMPLDPSGRSPATPMDNELLMPVPHKDLDSSHDLQVAAGSRHTLVRTSKGQVYGWGWNEDSALLPLTLPSEEKSQEGQGWTDNVIPEPTLMHIGNPTATTETQFDVDKVVASTGRSFAIGTGLAVAGSNEFGCLALAADVQGLETKPRFEREFSQIKKTFECVNGLQPHPTFCNGDAKVIDVHATSLATLFTIRERTS